MPNAERSLASEDQQHLKTSSFPLCGRDTKYPFQYDLAFSEMLRQKQSEVEFVMKITKNSDLYKIINRIADNLNDLTLDEDADRLKLAMSISAHTGEILGALRAQLDHIKTNTALRSMWTEIEDALDYIIPKVLEKDPLVSRCGFPMPLGHMGNSLLFRR